VLRERTTFVVALTGGIASGKSVVARNFDRLGVPLFDADIVAHALVQKGQESLEEISSVFGNSVLDNSGALDRRRMRELVFGNTDARRSLEKILHPRIHSILIEQVEQVERCSTPFCVLAIPLFTESQRDYSWVDRVLVTDVPRRIQIDRLVQRQGIDNSLAERIVDAQATRTQRLSLANDIIDNTAPIERLAPVVSRLQQLYLRLATQKTVRRSET
jgi:dephospho-CoA kinase